MNDWKKYTQPEHWHPAASVFPILPDDELWDMAADIEANGLQNPIALFEDKVLDGRNRVLACLHANEKPEFYTWEAKGRSPLTWVLSQNTHRRHLTQGQKAFVAIAVEELLAVEARKRQGARNDIVEIIPQSEAGKSRDQAAKIVGVNPRYISDAKRIAKEAPELAEKVKAGDLSIPEAKREIRQTDAKPEEPPTPDARRRRVTNLITSLYQDVPDAEEEIICLVKYIAEMRLRTKDIHFLAERMIHDNPLRRTA